MIFSHQLNQFSEELEEIENEGGEEEKRKMISEVDFEAELDTEVSNWTSFPTSLAASTQTLGIFVPRSRTSTPTISLFQPNHLWTYSPTLAQV